MPSKGLPMAPAAYAQWCRALASSTCDYLSTIRESEAVRLVTSRANNVSGMYPSRKMSVTIHFESQNPELWAIVAMDRDGSALEFFEQPDTFKIRSLDTSGKKMGDASYALTQTESKEESCRRGWSLVQTEVKTSSEAENSFALQVSTEADAVSAPAKPKRTRRVGEPKAKRYPAGETERNR